VDPTRIRAFTKADEALRLLRLRNTPVVATADRASNEVEVPIAPLELLHTAPPSEKTKRSVLSFVDPNLAHQEAMAQFLRTIDRIIRFNPSLSPLPSQTPEQLKTAYDSCHKLWSPQEKLPVFLGEEKLLRSIAGSQHEEAFALSLPPHDLTGYTNSFRTPTAITLAQDYAFTTQAPMNIAFGDVMNVGGTNVVFQNSLKERTNIQIDELIQRLNMRVDNCVNLEEKREAVAKRLTDWSVRIMTGILRETIEAEFSKEDKDQMQFLGSGGDEFCIICPGDKEKFQQAINAAKSYIHRVIKDLGLSEHWHPKKHIDTGLGLTISKVEDMTKIEQKTFSQKPSPENITNTKKTEGTEAELNLGATTNYDLKIDKPIEEPKLTDLNGTLEKLEKKYIKYKPEFMSPEALSKLLVLQDDDQVFPSIDHVIRYQLCTLFNNSTGVQDARVIPKFIEAKKLDPKSIHLVTIACKNITAVNDQASHDQTDRIVLRDLAKTVRQYIKRLNNDAEVFSNGGGKFTCVIPNANEGDIKTFVGLLPTAAPGINQKDIVNNRGVTVKVGELINHQTDENGIRIVATAKVADKKDPYKTIDELFKSIKNL